VKSHFKGDKHLLVEAAMVMLSPLLEGTMELFRNVFEGNRNHNGTTMVLLVLHVKASGGSASVAGQGGG